jgi:MFS family permease
MEEEPAVREKSAESNEPLSRNVNDCHAPEGSSNPRWIGPDDPQNPRNFTNARKWTLVCASLLATLLIPLNGTSIIVATAQIDNAFNISNTPFPNSYWLVTSWTLGGATFLIVGMAVMEDVGVRRSFLWLYGFFILMIIPQVSAVALKRKDYACVFDLTTLTFEQAVAQNFATLIVTRFLSGGCVALLANTASSVIPDIWSSEEERSLPISIWILCYLLGESTPHLARSK